MIVDHPELFMDLNGVFRDVFGCLSSTGVVRNS